MITRDDIRQVFGADVYDTDGDKIGPVGQVYLDDRSGAPAWASIKTGLFGTKESFAPLDQASLTGDRLEVPFSKAQVKDAPRIDVDGDLSPAQEDELYTYYGLSSTGDHAWQDTSTSTSTSRTSTSRTDTGGTDTGHDTSGPSTDEAMTRSEEHLVAGTRTEEAGRARLRKYVVTEQEQVTVPVSHEEVTLQREPITDANIGQALDGPDISEEEHELTLHAERPVADTETVPVERVRLGKETVTDQETIGGEVRKEQIEFEGADGTENRPR